MSWGYREQPTKASLEAPRRCLDRLDTALINLNTIAELASMHGSAVMARAFVSYP